jgi:hypothetical protein
MGELGRRDGPGSEDLPSPWFQRWDEGGWMDYGDVVQNRTRWNSLEVVVRV